MTRAALQKRLRSLRALVLDVDGVLTDGGLYYGPQGDALKKFNVKDGMGLRLLREAGFSLAIITGENTPVILRRAEKLKIADVYVGVEEKGRALSEFIASRKLSADQVAYMGDDVNDLPAMAVAGLPIAVADAVPEVRKAADWVTTRPGGEGAVREVCDAILASRAGTSKARR